MGDQNQQPPADNQQPQGDQSAQGGDDKVMRIGKYNVKIVRSACIGAATCVAVSPDVYELDGENIAVFKDGASDTDENTLAAAQGCPTKAIILTDAETGEQVWPK